LLAPSLVFSAYTPPKESHDVITIDISPHINQDRKRFSMYLRRTLQDHKGHTARRQFETFLATSKVFVLLNIDLRIDLIGRLEYSGMSFINSQKLEGNSMCGLQKILRWTLTKSQSAMSEFTDPGSVKFKNQT
jgi:hypothetical protein